MDGHFFAMLSRMRHIARWGLMRNTQPENLQEHSYMTAVLAHALAVIRRDVFGTPCDPERAAVAALFHDAGEIFTGDLPTPVKYFTPGLREAYREVEQSSLDKLLSMLPEELRRPYRPFLYEEELDAQTEALVRAADKLAAYLKCMEETRANNPEFAQAQRQTLEKLAVLSLPEVAWFLERCAPSFGLSLDELEDEK